MVPTIAHKPALFLDRNYLPILRWAGSKQWAAPMLKTLYQQHDRELYLEPMCGGLGSALGVGAKYAALSDLNLDLIGLYRRSVGHGLPVRDFGTSTEDFYTARDRFNSPDCQDMLYERAELMYYLNRRCFRGLYRTNKKGFFNTPVGEPKQQVDSTTILQLPDTWSFRTSDYAQFYECYDLTEGFMVVDPPYDQTGVAYGSNSFDVDNVVDRIPTKLGVVYFNSDTPAVRTALQRNGFTMYNTSEPRSMNAGHGSCKQTIIVATRCIAHSDAILRSYNCEEIM